MANNSATFSVIGPDVTIKGNIEASADLHVDGRVEGDLTCQSLVQGEASHIDGNIKADRARLSGNVKGTIAAKELVILKSARVEGDVTYDTLTIEQGATVDGRFAPKGMKPEARSTNPAARPATATPDAQAKGDEPKLSLAGQ
ncbi:bactofilin family protein [Alteraurantiacibacter aquimixticola]|uniref:Polymer-forming cytoskeletal protein n=1 Tax=Alteraurantiacibacter aquimixticola TaxID=2489173 RepID=A0A4V4U8A7_9SPHN|nr:polymer-forming cytoskeletal protein [Alteraurantiacibacter aquimixticola]TIX49177.1 polymer-forming cytoskeletal protein [Alteraurantiacibacter aquimixticola]